MVEETTGSGSSRWRHLGVLSAIRFSLLPLLWIWRQIIGQRFCRMTTMVELRLIAAHPDHLGGLGFLDSLLGRSPFSF